jgi:replication factor C subunit 2/4
VALDDEAMATLSAVSGGDLRKAITTLQSAVRLSGATISRAAILDVSGQVPPEVVDGLLAACRSGHFGRLQAAVQGIIADGFSAQQVLVQLQAALLADGGASSSTQKGAVCEALAAADKCLVDGADELLQLLHVAAVAQKALCGGS